MKRIYAISLYVLGIGCSSQSNVDVGGAAGASTALAPVSGELMFLDSSGAKRETFFGVAGDNIDLPVQLSKGNVSEFSLGYSDKHPQIELNGARVSLRGPAAGAYHIAIVARHRANCQASRQTDCEITNRQVSKTYPLSDLQKSIVIKIVNQSDLSPTGVGQGGGFMGQILRGEGLIGNLAKMFMGGGAGGGGLFGGAGAATGTQGTNPAGSVQPGGSIR